MKGNLGHIKVRLVIPTFGGVNITADKKLLPLKYASACHNFTFDGGALKGKIGVSAARLALRNSTTGTHSLPTLTDNTLTMTNVHFYRRYDFNSAKRDDKIVVRASDGTFYYTSVWDNDIFTEIQNMSVPISAKDYSVNYRYNGDDVLLVSSSEGGLYIVNGTTATYVAEAPKITSMCVHYERIYATVAGEKNSIWFSSLFNPENWTESGSDCGFIDFADDGGSVNKVVSLHDYVYVFRDYAVYRLSAYADTSDFYLSRVLVSSSRILPDTIAVCGDKIIMLTENGLYSFNGYSMTRIAADSMPKFLYDKASAVACAVNGKYYLACSVEYDIENPVLCESSLFLNNGLIRYDLMTGETDFMRGVDIKKLYAIETGRQAQALAICSAPLSNRLGMMSESGKLYDTILPKLWQTEESDLGYSDKIKVIRDITLVSETDCTVTVVFDGTEYSYAVYGSTAPSRIVVNKSGKTVAFKIECFAEAAYITNPVIKADLV